MSGMMAGVVRTNTGACRLRATIKRKRDSVAAPMKEAVAMPVPKSTMRMFLMSTVMMAPKHASGIYRFGMLNMTQKPAAAMAAALPTSAWHPPSAPATQALVVRLRPMAAAQ